LANVLERGVKEAQPACSLLLILKEKYFGMSTKVKGIVSRDEFFFEGL
jgi:hypothetical protein